MCRSIPFIPARPHWNITTTVISRFIYFSLSLHLNFLSFNSLDISVIYSYRRFNIIPPLCKNSVATFCHLSVYHSLRCKSFILPIISSYSFVVVISYYY